MGRTLPSITQVFHMEEGSLARYKRALRRSDQIVLEDLLTSAQRHLSAASHAAHALPMEIFLLSMLLEERKTSLKLAEHIAALLVRMEQLEEALPEMEAQPLVELNERASSSGARAAGPGQANPQVRVWLEDRASLETRDIPKRRHGIPEGVQRPPRERPLRALKEHANGNGKALSPDVNGPGTRDFD